MRERSNTHTHKQVDGLQQAEYFDLLEMELVLINFLELDCQNMLLTYFDIYISIYIYIGNNFGIYTLLLLVFYQQLFCIVVCSCFFLHKLKFFARHTFAQWLCLIDDNTNICYYTHIHAHTYIYVNFYDVRGYSIWLRTIFGQKTLESVSIKHAN